MVEEMGDAELSILGLGVVLQHSNRCGAVVEHRWEYDDTIVHTLDLNLMVWEL